MICKVLVVDDASFVRMMIRQVLVRLGHIDILEAKNGFEAIELYKANIPVLTILDITMAELDGLSTLKEIISFDPTAKVIMCSACCSSNIVDEALNLGAIDFISKPFRPDELGKIITKYL
ncbi:response regulator [Desulfosporosinus sp. BICA1-9]|uniref:response regulator n=1 Tax=Desulfosporosinus sp. BICA1-9 TaxID=1531958 RepID=UPI00054B5426|nr:response regulator [Desulfosporosinus sp. BICA1-9]KJS48034.1 MAG: chemotaxis protein CheY [Peptococcaceae bacterium BRH_c23]KJS90240.1 MAG: chemotaxis protein CheY [Desulfosporosinus sp. BICA1-9]HBW39022.1 response regulator [Desulfosporosinus sp.]